MSTVKRSEETLRAFFEATKSGYMKFIFLQYEVHEALDAIQEWEGRIGEDETRALLLGPSWRERLWGLCFAARRGYSSFIVEMIRGLEDIRVSSLVPTAAALSVAITDFACPYDPSWTSKMRREALDGEMGYALDCLHAAIGLQVVRTRRLSPHEGQSFWRHRDFHRFLSSTQDIRGSVISGAKIERQCAFDLSMSSLR